MKTYWRTWYVQTAHRARLEGVPVSRDYGYVVRVRPAPAPGEYGKRPGCESLEAWCNTKAIAERHVQDNERHLSLGYFECPCGSNKQAGSCCGIPSRERTA